MNRIIYTFIFSFLIVTFNANSLEMITGHVKVLEPTYMPNSISFSMTVG
jgi:hypothetical protein